MSPSPKSIAQPLHTTAVTTPSLSAGPSMPAQRDTGRRRLPQSKGGERWVLGPKLGVRFSKDLTRIHGDRKPNQDNLVKLKYLDGDTGTRPVDAILAELVRLAALPAGHPSLTEHGRRCWLLTQTETGWSLALELRGGPEGRQVTPGRDADGQPVGVAVDRVNLPATREVARTLLAAALSHSENPDREVHPLVLEQLRTAQV